jgi:hypothetical protein
MATMSVDYLLQFGTGDPRTYTGLAATFLIFKDTTGNNVTPPGITEIPSSTGLYYFTWGVTTSIYFLADAATTSPGTAGRYIAGNLVQSDRIADFGITLNAIGTSHIAQGNSAIALGITNVAIGTSLTAQGVSLFALGTSAIAQGVTETALGNTILANVGIGLTLNGAIGSTASSFGNNVTDPVDLFGYVKRISELIQGREAYVKGVGTLTMFDRTGGTTFVQRTVTNSASMVLKG